MEQIFITSSIWLGLAVLFSTRRHACFNSVFDIRLSVTFARNAQKDGIMLL
jgi:hypothetical protein